MEIYADISYRYFRKRYDKKGENGMEIPNNYFHNEKKIDSIADLKAIGKSIIKLFEEAGDNTEEKKKKMLEKIRHKLESGKKLTAEEMQFLQKNYPELYVKAKKIEIKRKTVEERLKHCKSKEEVQEVMDQEIGIISDKDPDKVYLIKAVEEAVKEFKNTSDYKKLPEKKEDKNEDKKEKSQTRYSIKTGEYQMAWEEEEHLMEMPWEAQA